MITDKNTILKIKTFGISGKAAIYIKADCEINKVTLSVRCSGKTTDYSFGAADKEVEKEFVIENPELWSVSEPRLYEFLAEIFYSDDETEKVSGRFGIRTLSTDRKFVLLNGEPVYVKGYIRGATAHDHANNEGLSAYDFYKKNLLAAKRFGFNFVRFHSTVPPKELFDAADEIGMLIHIEFRKPDDAYNNLEEMLFAKRGLVSEEFVTKTIDELYNHPSLAEYCIGNELKTVPEEEKTKLGRFIKDYDGTRLFIDTCAWGRFGRPNIDLEVQHMSYYFPFGKHADMFDDAASIHTLKDEGISAEKGVNPYSVPLLAHEVCHYTALRDFSALKEKFCKFNRPAPWWIDEELKLIEEKGYGSFYKKAYEASKCFQKECWKTAFEAMRRSRILSGYHFLQLADTDVYENSNGIVDCFDDESYITPEDFLSFTGDRVLLTELGNRVFEGGNRVVLPAIVSDFGRDGVKSADFACTLTINGKVVYGYEKKNVDLSEKGYNRFDEITVELPKLSLAEKAGLKFSLRTEGKTLTENSWNIRIYPAYKKMTYADFCLYENGDVSVTSDIKTALKKMQEGKKVCLIYRAEWTRHVKNKTQKPPEYAFKATWNRFKPVIWDRGTNYGGLCDKKTLNKYGFPSEEFYDFAYDELTEDCDKIILDDFPCNPKVLVFGIDKSVRDRFDAYKVSFNLPELMPDRTLRRFGYLFELSVEKGKLLVCGMNLTGLDNNSPAALSMANFILDYMKSEEFAPTAAVSYKAIEEYLKACAKTPVKERMMTQFWELDEEPVESKKYWEESRTYLTEK